MGLRQAAATVVATLLVLLMMLQITPVRVCGLSQVVCGAPSGKWDAKGVCPC